MESAGFFDGKWPIQKNGFWRVGPRFFKITSQRPGAAKRNIQGPKVLNRWLYRRGIGRGWIVDDVGVMSPQPP